MSVTQEFRKLRKKKYHEFETSLVYKVRLSQKKKKSKPINEKFFCTDTDDIYLLAVLGASVWGISVTLTIYFWFRFFCKTFSKSSSRLPFYTY